MSNAQTPHDDVDGLLELLAGKKPKGRPTKGAMTITEDDIPLTSILMDQRIQFRDDLNDDTKAWVRDVVTEGGTLDPIIVVESVVAEPAEVGKDAVIRAVQADDEEVDYLAADGFHRITVTDEVWDEARDAAEDAPEPRMRAIVVHGARNPLAVAQELAIRVNIRPQTPVNDHETETAAYRMRQLYPDETWRAVAQRLKMSHSQLIRLVHQREVRDVLETKGGYDPEKVPSNLHLDYMWPAGAPTYPDFYHWVNLANVIKREKWRAREDLKPAMQREQAISERDWSHLEDLDPDGTPTALREWNNTDIVTRIQLAHQANKNGWTDEELLRSARYLDDLEGEVEGLKEAKTKEEKQDYKTAKQEYEDMLHGRLPPDMWMPEPETPVTLEPAPASTVNTGGVPTPAPSAKPETHTVITPFPAKADDHEDDDDAAVSTSAATVTAGEEEDEAEARRKNVRQKRHADMDEIEARLGSLEDHKDDCVDDVSEDDIKEINLFAARLTALAQYWFDAQHPQQQVAQ